MCFGRVLVFQGLRRLGPCAFGNGIGFGIGQRDGGVGGGRAEYFQVALLVSVGRMALHRYHANAAAVGNQWPEHGRKNGCRLLDI